MIKKIKVKSERLKVFNQITETGKSQSVVGIWVFDVRIKKYFKISISLLILTILTIIFFEGCSYSFTGSSVPKHLKTISIPYCVDRSGSGEPNMADDFTNTLIEQFINDNSLQVTDKSNADALLDCTITSISDTPTIIEGGENVSARRITINAHVIYKDNVKRKTIFDKSFSDYGDYTNDGDIFSKRKEAIKNAIDKLTEDILLGVVSNW